MIFLKLGKNYYQLEIITKNYHQDIKSSSHLLLLTFILFIQYMFIMHWKTNTSAF